MLSPQYHDLQREESVPFYCIEIDELESSDSESSDNSSYSFSPEITKDAKHFDDCSTNSTAETASTASVSSCGCSDSSLSFCDWSIASSSSRTLNSLREDPWRQLDYQRRKLVDFHHGATCTFDHYSTKNGAMDPYSRGKCPSHDRCAAVRRMYDHVTHCSQSGNVDSVTGLCRVPGCAQTRQVWSHYLNCNSAECLLCCIIPAATPKDPIALQKKIPRKHGRPPLSPKRK